MSFNNILKVGLTGGIGSGKSTVANLFAELGVDVIDADVAARDVVEPGNAGYQAVVEHFGKNILNEDSTIDRSVLRKLIFNDDNERLWLEQTLHPLIREKIHADITTAKPPYCIVVVPLLTEADDIDYVDRILVVDCPEELQIRHVIERDQIDEKFVRLIMDSQNTREQRNKKADDIIVNDQDIEQLKSKVAELDKLFKSL